jgi:hypothetical protein
MEVLLKNLVCARRENFSPNNFQAMLGVILSNQARWLGPDEMTALLIRRKVANKRGVGLVLRLLYGMPKSSCGIKYYQLRSLSKFFPERLTDRLNPVQFALLKSVLLYEVLSAVAMPAVLEMAVTLPTQKKLRKPDPRDSYKAPESAYRA